MNSSTFWLLVICGCALLNQGWCRPQQDDVDYVNDGDGDADYNEDEDGDDDSGPPPELLSKPVQLVLSPGETAIFPCHTTGDINKFSRLWRKDTKTGLFIGSVRQTQDPRISLLANGSLELKQVSVNDVGTYSCLISATNQQQVEHTLSVKGPAKITKVMPHEGTITVKEHGVLIFECFGQGFPIPNTYWYKEGSNLDQRDEDPSSAGARYVIADVKPDDAGTYQCRTSNEGQANPDTKTVIVHVISPPVIKIDRAVVPTGEGYDSEISCDVYGPKKSELKWYKNGVQKPLTASARIKFEVKEPRHTLKIYKTDSTDFGDYTCEAKNSEGSVSSTITLTGTPAAPELAINQVDEETKSPILEYKVESFAPIEEYELLYKRDSKDEWISLNPTVNPSSDGNFFVVKHKFSGLEPGNYEAKLRAKNNYGWSTFSSTYQFPQEHMPDLRESGLLESVLTADTSAGAEMRISFLLLFVALVARFYC